MKKQVLSFTEFINEAYSMVNEGKDWSDVKRALSDSIDSDAKDFLAYMEDCFNSDARDNKTKILDIASESFSKIIKQVFNGEYTKISGVSNEIKELIYDKSIQGKIDVAEEKSIMGQDFELSGQKVGSFNSDSSGRMKIEDFLNMINLYNLKKLTYSEALKTNKKGRAEFANISKDDKISNFLGLKRIGEGQKIEGSGSEDQYYITEMGTQISIAKWENKNKIKPFSGTTPVTMSADVGVKRGVDGVIKKDLKRKAGQAAFTYVFYTLDPSSNKDNVKNKSKEYESITGIKEVKIPVKEPDTVQTLVVQDQDTLFVVGKSSLTDEGKINLNNAILSNFTSVSEITVQGSASQEGPAAKKNGYSDKSYEADKKYNLDLAADRADEVITYLGKICRPGAKISAANPKSVIQDKALNEKERPSHRNVTLTIKGTKVNKGGDSEKVVYIPTKDKIKYDRIIIKEIQMTFFVEIREEKMKRLVDRDMKGHIPGGGGGRKHSKWGDDSSTE